MAGLRPAMILFAGARREDARHGRWGIRPSRRDNCAPWHAFCVIVTGAVFFGGGQMAQDVHPVDEFLPVPKLLTLGLQHVLVMYAGAVAVPLILGRALKLPPQA